MIITVEPNFSTEEVKAAAEGRWLEILSQNGIPYETLNKKHHPCPKCGGKDRFRMIDNRVGAVICNQCFNTKNGDGLAALQWWLGCDFKTALQIVAEHCGLVATSASEPVKRDLVEDVCRDKRMPIEAFKQFSPVVAKRGRSSMKVVRVATFDENGQRSGYFDFAVNKKGWNAKGKPAGLFLPSRLPQPGERWLIVEGCKDAAALISLGYNAAGLPMNVMAAKFAKLFSGCDVVLVPDLDDAGQSGSQKTGGRLAGIASSVKVARLPGEIVASGGDDVRDVIRIHGDDRVKEAIESAEEWKPKAGQTGSDEGKPEIVLSSNLNISVDLASQYVGKLGWDTDWISADKRERVKVYQRAGELVEVVIEADDTDVRGVAIPAGSARIRPLPIPQLVLRVSDSCKLIRETETESDGLIRKQVPPERWLIDGVATRGYWEHVRRLEGVIQSPTIRPDGSILQKPGWDKLTGLLYLPGSAKFDPIPDKPSQDDAKRAVAELVEVVADFPFESPADQSAWLAMVLTMLGRPAIAGCCPMFAISATVRGSGKSLLTDAASLIAYGRKAARKTYPGGDDAEMRKVITAVALEALPSIMLDNVDSTLGGASLDAALTAEYWSDRVLGSNRTTGELPLRSLWLTTGNNLRFGSDIARRVLPIRVSPQCENPEERSDFQHSDLLGWVTTNRERLAVAALTILRAYFEAGKPSQPGGTFGSFESWSSIVRGAIVWCGCADPLLTREAAKEDDTSAAIVAGLIGGLLEVDETGDGVTAREIVKALNDENNGDKFTSMREVVAEVATTKGVIDAKRLGYQLRKYRGRIAKGFKIGGETGHGGVIRWRIVKVKTIHVGDGCDVGDAPTRCQIKNELYSHATTTGDNKNSYKDGPELSPTSPSSPPEAKADRMFFE